MLSEDLDQLLNEIRRNVSKSKPRVVQQRIKGLYLAFRRHLRRPVGRLRWCTIVCCSARDCLKCSNTTSRHIHCPTSRARLPTCRFLCCSFGALAVLPVLRPELCTLVLLSPTCHGTPIVTTRRELWDRALRNLVSRGVGVRASTQSSSRESVTQPM